MSRVHRLRVFTNEAGNFGNPVNVVLDEGRKIDNTRRQAITRKFKHDETVFVDDLAGAKISIFNPQQEVGFAGHAMVGAAWLLIELKGSPVDAIHCLGGDIYTWDDNGLIWIRASLTMMPPWHHRQLDSAKAVENIQLEATRTWEHIMVWAWVDEAKGLIRARTFAADWDIPEAQGNGSGSMMLAAQLGRAIQIKHGQGSVIFAAPAKDNQADLGGRVVEVNR